MIYVRILSISDSSCIDLASLEKLSLQQIADLANSEFENMTEGSASDIRQVLANGYTLPSIMIIKVKGDSGLVGNLLVADVCQCGPVERSVQLLKQMVLAMDPTSMSENELSSQESFLTCLLTPFVGGDALSAFVFDLQPEVYYSNPRALHHGLQFAEAVRRIKNRATQHSENPLIKELSELAVFNEKLESERKTAHRQLASLKHSMSKLQEDRTKLVSAFKSANSNNEIQRLEFEYEHAKMELEQIELQDQLRKCEIEIVTLDQQNIDLIQGLQYSEAMAKQLEVRKVLSKFLEFLEGYETKI